MSIIHPIKSENTGESTRTHIVIPEEVIRKLDQLVGPRGRSRFVVEAVVERLNHINLQQAASKVAGSLRDTHIPGWETGEKTSAWVREGRREADKTQAHTD